MKLLHIATLMWAACLCMAACTGEEKELIKPEPETPAVDEELGDIHSFKAPLYWSVYEYCWERERAGVAIDLTESQWDEIIDWVATNLKPHGYDMVCTDGFISMLAKESHPYMTHYGSISLKKLVAKAKAKGLKVGIYDNPLWIHCGDNVKVEGTNVTVGKLKWQGIPTVKNPGVNDKWFTWVVAENNGAKEYIDGFFKYYKELGVDYIRMDFLSWYEDGWDRGFNTNVGRGYGRESYAKALSYIAQAAKKYGVFTSLVMPHSYKDAELEAKYGNMFRVVCDTQKGEWGHISANDRGKHFSNWPQFNNQFDGLIYFSRVSGRGKVMLDGDFLRLNKLKDANERMTAVSLQLMAGGPVTVADLPSTIGNCLQYYTNDELLALNTDRFVGKPLSDNITNTKSQIWYGTMSNGDGVVALFNRSDMAATMTATLSELGFDGKYQVRDLWTHTDEGEADKISARIPAHGCKVVRISK